MLGRPNAIQDDYTCTLPPLNVDDEFSPAAIRNPPPLTCPTPMTFVILRHQLASIIGRMVHHFQKVNTPSHYSDVLALDDELLKFVSNLPPHFAFDPDTSLDEKKQFLLSHRFLLTTEILFVRVSLHRPYLLRKLNSDRYLRSRTACFESAIKDFEVRKAFREKMPKETRESLHNAYREFQTAMISGIYLVLDPRGKDADTMHTVLDVFLKDHEGVREMDETTRREVKIIEFLRNRALQIAESMAQNAEHDLHPLMDSQLESVAPATPAISRHGPTFSSILATTSDSASPRLYPASPFNPAVQRLQHSGSTDGTLSSPAGTNSPSGEEESTAQSLLDHWCSTFNDVTVDGPAGMPAFSWGGPGGDFPGWVEPSADVPLAIDPNLMPTSDGDWNYWENLVSQIKTGPIL